MTNMSAASNYSNNGAPTALGQDAHRKAFLNRVTYTNNQITELSHSVKEIATLHNRAISSVDSSSSAQLEATVSQTQAKIREIRDSIKYLESEAAKDPSSISISQVRRLRNDFQAALSKYHDEESKYKDKYREQIKRQYLIVNPDAPDEEVNQAMEMDWANEGVFRSAVR
jgi:syntaxin 1B/2/3